MTKNEFKRLWTQEANNQPGFILDVLLLEGVEFSDKAA